MNKVFCIGLSRTGTTSLSKALEMMGYKSLHFPLGLFLNPQVISEDLSFFPQRTLSPYFEWIRKKEIEQINEKFDKKILVNYDAFSDLPIPLYFKELDDKFPKSKFIYTYREEEKWLESIHWLMNDGAVLWTHGFIHEEINHQAYGCFQFNRKQLLKIYREHHANVLSYFKDRPEDLLKLNIDQHEINFEQLCDFLNEPDPASPFPKINEQRSVTRIEKIWYYILKKIPPFGLIRLILLTINQSIKKSIISYVKKIKA